MKPTNHAIFESFPALRERLPIVPLAQLPTPILEADVLAHKLNALSVHIKRDDISGEVYGGNKVRKLEFILGKALAEGAKEVITFGYAGSNHALATAIYANRNGLRAVSLLLPQPNAHYVRRNLLAGHGVGAKLRQLSSRKAIVRRTVFESLIGRLRNLKAPVIIPPGGSSPLGAASFVNAAFELKAQVDAGILPKPGRIYIAMGSLGSSVGLLLGACAARLDTTIVAVRVTDDHIANIDTFRALYDKTAALLREADSSFPRVPFDPERLEMRHEFFGKEYALWTNESAEAVRFMNEHLGLPLEGTYTGKALAAMMADGRSGKLRDKHVLFWNTYNSRDIGPISSKDYRTLPGAFRRYFEDEIQPLDTD